MAILRATELSPRLSKFLNFLRSDLNRFHIAICILCTQLTHNGKTKCSSGNFLGGKSSFLVLSYTVIVLLRVLEAPESIEAQVVFPEFLNSARDQVKYLNNTQ